MAEFVITIKGVEQLRQAVRNNPQNVLKSVASFLKDAISIYKRGIIRSPWRMGMGGGGAPVAMIKSSKKGRLKESGKLRDTHMTDIGFMSASIYPTAPYASYVHGIDGYPRTRTYQLRPWLDYVIKDKEAWIQALEERLLDNIVGNLVK